ncbi:MAG: S8 family serine peptidase, partial [Thermoanaerobaculia bacterium]
MTRRAKELDPKLRRLVHSLDDPRRLELDVARATLAVAEGIDPQQPVTPEALTRRVLVRLVSNRVPPAMADLDWVQIVEGIHSVAVPIHLLEELAASPEVEFVEAGRQMSPGLVTSVPETRADRVRNPPPPRTGLDGTGVAVGIIDFGFDFSLDDFRNPDGTTRVAFLWDQTLTPENGERSPDRFGHGVEYDRDAIDQALQNSFPFTRVRHQPSPGSHGTHVAGIAAGSGRSGDDQFPAGRFVGTAPGATIIFVQPDSSDADTTLTDSVHVTEAVAYVFEKAAELGLPCVINMSLAQNGGSHDGESLVERAIDRLLEQPGRALVVAAGNEHLWRGHASGTLATGDQRTLQWKFGGGLPLPTGGATGQGNDFTPNEMEIWYSSRDRLTVRIVAPDGEATTVVSPGDTEIHVFSGGEKAFLDSERFTVLNGDARIYIEISPPTTPGGRVRPGVWRVEIEAEEVQEGRFDAWIERDLRRSFNNFADQSFFLGADFDPVMTLGTPAT